MQAKQTMMLKPEVILRYLISNDDETDTMILCKSSEINLVTTDQVIYEAMCCINPKDDFNFNKLKKLFEVTDVHSFKHVFKKQKSIITEKRVEELRNLALNKEHKEE